MRRRAFIAALSSAAAWPVLARAQQPARMRRIGVLQPVSESDPESQLRKAAFVDGLQKFGWKDGTNVLIDYRWAGGDADRVRLYATELTGMRPDVIWASGALALLPLKRATRTIPIVFTSVYDPVGSGFVTSLTRPGDNITGFTLGEFSMGGKTLEVLKEVAPQVSRVAVILNLEQPPHVAMWRSIEATAPSFGVRLTPADVQGPAEIERAIEAFAREPNGGLIVLPAPVTVVHRELITAGGPASPSGGLRISVFRHWRWLGVVWHRPRRPSPASGQLHRSHPQGREASQSTSASAHKVRACHQSQNRQGARPRHSADAARPRRSSEATVK
jgi:putative tryptophan/tyrosine transport system substrate-binding protein